MPFAEKGMEPDLAKPLTFKRIKLEVSLRVCIRGPFYTTKLGSESGGDMRAFNRISLVLENLGCAIPLQETITPLRHAHSRHRKGQKRQSLNVTIVSISWNIRKNKGEQNQDRVLKYLLV